MKVACAERNPKSPHGQREEEGRPLPHFALHPDFAVMGLRDVLDDGQAQAGAALLPGARLVDPIKALEDAVDGLRRDSRPVVANKDLYHLRLGRAGADPDATFGAAVLDGVIDKVEER